MIKEIENRRSIRKYADTDIPEHMISKIVEAGIKAPSAKNRQPWKFIAVKGKSKEQMLEAFQRGLVQERAGNGMLPDSRQYIAGAEYSMEIMRQAPVTVFVINTLGRDMYETLTPEEKVYDIANIESVSAAIQNMLLTAEELGIGSLWICDVFFAYNELSEWLNTDGEMVAAVSFGYPLESPKERLRKSLEDVFEWRK